MNLVCKRTGGANLVCRPQARRPWYPAERSRPVQVEVWWRYVVEPASVARLLGTFAPGQSVTYPFNPLVDRDIVLSTISISVNGRRSVRNIADAPETLLTYQCETSVPTVGQIGTSTHTSIQLAIDNYSTLAIKRRIRIADDSAMTVSVQEEFSEVSPGQVLPRVVLLTRADGGSGTRSIWVRVSHSSGGAYSDESPAAEFIYADSGGIGGGSGDQEPFPVREYPLP